MLRGIPGSLWLDKHHHFATGLVRFHHSMRFTNLLKAKYPDRFRLVTTGGYLISDGLERNIRQRKARLAEHKTAEEAKVNSARHLEEWVEVGHRIKPAPESLQGMRAHPAAA
jgi:hypothetical protein